MTSREATARPSLTSKLTGHLMLIHPLPVLFVLLGTGLFGLVAAGGHPSASRFVLMLTAMLGSQVAIGALNELCDRGHDAVHQPDKPIPAGLVRPGSVPPIIAGGLAVAVVAGWLLGTLPLALLLVGTASGIVYDLWLKRTPFFGIPYLIALPLLPVWAWLVMDVFDVRLLWLYPLGGGFVLSIHLAQSLSDIEGDRASGARGLAVVLGFGRALRLIWVIAIGTALLMPLGALLIGEQPVYALIASAAALVLFAGFAVTRARRARDLDGIPMEVLAGGAILLATGWILALAG